MRHSCKASLGLAVLTLAALSGAAHAGGPVFSDTAANSTSFRSGDAPFTFISAVTTDTAITSFAIENQMVTAGNLEFLIFNDATGTLLYNSGAIAYGADAIPTFKQSPTLAFTLLAGQTYDFGALADVSANYPYFFPGSFTQNGITSKDNNANVENFPAPDVYYHAGARIPLILNNDSNPVPEASTTVSLGLLLTLGLGGVLTAARKKKSGASI